MNAIRRTTLKAAGAAFLLASGLLQPLRALAAGWNKAAFASKTPADALKNQELYGEPKWLMVDRIPTPTQP